MKSNLSILFFIMFCLTANGQSVGINTATPDVNAILDIHSTDKGILIPRVTENARLSMKNVTPGMMVYDIDNSMFYCHNGNGWAQLSIVGAFENNNGVVRNVGSVDDDFVFGMESLPNNTTKYTENLFFFDEEKGAFRAGRLNNSKNWGTDSIGFGSMALGYNSKAKGQSSVSIGYDNKANAPYGIAIGFGNEAEGDFSTAMGIGTDAESYAGMSVGRINVGGGDPDNWVLTDPVFEVGIGTHSVTDRRNAMTILKNGKTGIGTATPDTTFTVVGVSRAALDDSENDYIEMSHGGNNAFINKAGAGNIDIRHEDANIMTLTSGKDVGIGTNSPDTKLSVIGKVRGAYESNENEFTEIYHGGGNGFINTVGDGNLDFRHDNDTKMSLTDGGNLTLDGHLTLGNANTSQDYTFPNADGNSNQYLKTDGNGNLSWTNLILSPFTDSGATMHPVSGSMTDNFLIGSNTLPGINGLDKMVYYNDAKNAFRHGYINNSDEWDVSNLGLGSFATGHNVLASGSYSMAIGDRTEATAEDAFASGELTNATGAKSVAFGDNTTASGENAFAIGWTGNATGKTALKTGRNTFANGENSATFNQGTTANGLGSFAAGLLGTTNGNFSTAFGVGLQTNSYGTFAIGRYNEGIGSDLIAWDESLTAVDEPVFEVGIGTLATPKNAMTITKAGQIGIGTSSPSAFFEIEFNDPNGPYDPNQAMYVESGGNAAFAIGGSGSVSAFQDMFIHGQLDMWPSHEYSATYKIELPNIATLEDGVGNAYNWHTYSDKRVKKEIKGIPYGLNEVMRLRPVHYHHHSTDFKDGFILRDDYKEEIGFVAQETYEIIQEVVYKPEDESKSLWSMNYGKLTPVLVKAIQEQQKIIESLTEKVKFSDEKYLALKADLDDIKASIELLSKEK